MSDFAQLLDQGHHREAASWLVRQHSSEVLGLCRAMLRDRHAAEDATQDVFSRALSTLGSFRGEAAPRTWLMRIAKNRCIDELRRRKIQPWSVTEGGDVEELPLPPAADVSERLGDRAAVELALASLQGSERALVVLRYRHGMSYAELATAFGLREGTARMQVSRALARMRAVVQPALREPPSPAELREALLQERSRRPYPQAPQARPARRYGSETPRSATASNSRTTRSRRRRARSAPPLGSPATSPAPSAPTAPPASAAPQPPGAMPPTAPTAPPASAAPQPPGAMPPAAPTAPAAPQPPGAVPPAPPPAAPAAPPPPGAMPPPPAMPPAPAAPPPPGARLPVPTRPASSLHHAEQSASLVAKASADDVDEQALVRALSELDRALADVEPELERTAGRGGTLELNEDLSAPLGGAASAPLGGAASTPRGGAAPATPPGSAESWSGAEASGGAGSAGPPQPYEQKRSTGLWSRLAAMLSGSSRSGATENSNRAAASPPADEAPANEALVHKLALTDPTPSAALQERLLQLVERA